MFLSKQITAQGPDHIVLFAITSIQQSQTFALDFKLSVLSSIYMSSRLTWKTAIEHMLLDTCHDATDLDDKETSQNQNQNIKICSQT